MNGRTAQRVWFAPFIAFLSVPFLFLFLPWTLPCGEKESAAASERRGVKKGSIRSSLAPLYPSRDEKKNTRRKNRRRHGQPDCKKKRLSEGRGEKKSVTASFHKTPLGTINRYPEKGRPFPCTPKTSSRGRASMDCGFGGALRPLVLLLLAALVSRRDVVDSSLSPAIEKE